VIDSGLRLGEVEAVTTNFSGPLTTQLFEFTHTKLNGRKKTDFNDLEAY
jgi:hypothetical protein